MTNLVLLARDRYRLTEQCLRTLYMHTDESAFNLTIINDGSQSETTRLIEQYTRKHKNCESVHIVEPVAIIGFLKNLGVWCSERVFGRGDWLYLGDADTCFSLHWLDKMLLHSFGAFDLFGGQAHPFHHPVTKMDKSEHFAWEHYEMLDGPSWLMPWSTWDKFGPLDMDTAPGVCKGEDFTFCNRITAAGGRIGVISPHVVYHTGIKQTDGKLGPGADLRLAQRVPGVIFE